MENSVSKAIEKAQQFSGYLELKEYQRQTIEAYLSGRDVFVSAQTGYGKSLTFELAPHAFEYLSENNKSLVLVVVPLARSMYRFCRSCSFSHLRMQCQCTNAGAKRSDKYAANAIR
jgi:superfamily II DNA/RNA helicase